jgi:ubiquinone/menaquinone biosynthesis C-methylase UbiE
MPDVSHRIREFWDADAATYDATTSHAISDPIESAAWRQALVEALPPSPARILDAGAGTGALSLLAAEIGFDVTSLDLSAGMLAQAERKAADRRLAERMRFVVGPVEQPPDGPFDAVIERHVLWTVTDPVAALAAWRRVAGRVVLFEGVWGSHALGMRARSAVAEALRKVMRTPPDHHAPYPEDVLRELPLARLPSPEPLIDAIHAAGWRGVRIKRLRDVEWAAALHEPWPLGWLESLPRYALVADA